MKRRVSKTAASPAAKKSKNEQPDLTSFFASPGGNKQHSNAPISSTSNVISLLSDDESDTGITQPKPKASTSKSKSGSETTSAGGRPTHQRHTQQNAALVLGANEAGTTTLHPLNYPIERDLFEFDPALHIDTTSWPTSADGTTLVPYAFLASAFAKISATKSRLAITNLMANCLRTIICYQPAALLPAIYLITNHVAPAYEGVELGIGSQVLSASLKSVSGVSASTLKTLWNKHGDPGDVAFEAKSSVRTLVPTSPLTIVGVHATFLQIASLKGQGVTNKKSSLVNKMLVACKGEETRFLVRSLCANLRIGAVRLTVTSSLARALCLHQGQRVTCDPEYHSSLAIPMSVCEGVRSVAKTAKEGKDDPRRKALMARMAEAEAIVRKVYVKHPNYEHIVGALLRDDVGLEGLEAAVPLQVGTPLNNMLGQITRSLTDVSQRFNEKTEFAAEFKYDGQRIQVHARRRKVGESLEENESVTGKHGQWVGPERNLYVRLFSRHLEDMTDKYPDVLQLVYHMFERSKTNGHPIDSIIVDAEICAVDGPTGNLLDFQTLTTRARKDVAIGDVRVRAKLFAFDLMYLNGESLLASPFRQRRTLLFQYLPAFENSEDPTLARFAHVESMVGIAGDLHPVEEFFRRALASKCEGIMVKILDNEVVAKGSDIVEDQEEIDGITGYPEDTKPDVGPEATENGLAGLITPSKGKRSLNNKGSRKMLLPASYEPDKRADAWLKVKKDYAETGGDSLDLVPIAVWHGQGRKAGWWSPILLAVYDPASGRYSAVCKCISGFSDQFYKDLNERYPQNSETCFKRKPNNVETGIIPDWYLKPNEVWEIRGADISLSPVYPAAKGLLSGDRGLSLRFPRFMKLRTDKSIEQATTPQEFVEAYHRQQAGGGGVSSVEAKQNRDKKELLSGSEIEEYSSDQEADVLDEL